MRKNIVTLLALIPIIWISCDGIGRQGIDFRQVEALMPHHPDSALTLLEQIKDKEALSRKDKAHYYLLLTEAHDKAHVTHTTDSLISIAADYYEKTDDLGRKAKAWYYRGRVNQDLGHPLKAQEYYLKALRDEAQLTDYALLGRINNHIGMLYTYQTVYERALPFQKKAVEDFRMIRDSVGQVYALRDLSRVSRMLGYRDSAIVCNQKALSLMREVVVPSVYTELASLYLEEKQIERAYELLREALRNTIEAQERYPIYLVLGKLYKESHQVDSARFYLRACVDSSHSQTTRAGGLFHLKEIATAQKQWEQAVSLSRSYESLRDSIEKSSRAESIRNVQAFYAYNEVEQALWEVRLYALRQQERFILFIVGSLVLLTGFVIALIYYRRKRKDTLRQLRERVAQILKKEREVEYLSCVRDALRQEMQDYKVKMQEQTCENERQLKDTSERLKQKSEQLEKLSRIKASLEHDITLLKAENSDWRNLEEERKTQLALLPEGRLYERFRSPVSWVPTRADWDTLFTSVDSHYPGFALKLQQTVSLNETDKKICYLVKIGVKPNAVATLLNLENVSVNRKRLYEKLTGKSGKAKELDGYISDL